MMRLSLNRPESLVAFNSAPVTPRHETQGSAVMTAKVGRDFPWEESSEKSNLLIVPELESREPSIRSSRTWTAGFKTHIHFKRGLSFLSNVSSAVSSPRVPEEELLDEENRAW